MARITLTGRRVIPTGRVGEQELPPGFGQQKYRAQERLGGVLQQLGGEFVSMAARIRDAQARNELAQSQINYEREMDQHLIDQEKNPDIASWTLNTTKRHDEIVSQISTQKMLPKAKKQFGLWAQAQENRVHFRVATRSNTLLAENERNGLQLEMETSAIHGRRDDFEQHLDAMVKDKNLLTSEREDWLAKFDDEVTIKHTLALIEAEEYELAKQFIASEEDPQLRTQLSASLKGAKAAKGRENAAALREMKEQTYSTLLADYWDGALTNPQIVTDAVREGLLTPEAGKSLRKALLETEGSVHSSFTAVAGVEESLLKHREGLIDREEVLQTITSNASQLSPTDGKSFIKEAFGTQDTTNSRWDREAWDYIESQILSVSSMTGIMYGSGEQRALSAQAHIKYSEAKRQAAADGKPIQGEELLALAHKIMLPFRQQIKPLLPVSPGEGELPGRLEVTPFRRPSRFRSLDLRRGSFRRTSAGTRVSKIPATAKVPKSVEEFEATLKRISTLEKRRAYYNKWARKVYK